MDTHRPQKTEQRVEPKNYGGESVNQDGGSENQPSKQSSSPSHDFSFTISLHPSSTTLSTDLCPADDIFFHGHLLPLHLLSHIPLSPRSSTSCLDSFTLPIGDLMDVSKETCNSSSTLKTSNSKSKYHESNDSKTRGRTKSRPFSLFGLTKWRRESEVGVNKEEELNHKRKLKLDVSNILKRLLFLRGGTDNTQPRRQPFSFSGNLDMRGRMGEFSAPTSMRNSPSNSGLLVATPALPSSISDSTMEELQAAIQAAIAHCKNSISKEEKLNFREINLIA